jgi:hypothetical protein
MIWMLRKTGEAVLAFLDARRERREKWARVTMVPNKR